MSGPIILAVEDEAEVRQELNHDLARRYSADYQVLSVDSPETGLEALEEAQRSATAVAIVIASQRLPRMSGVEFLERAHELHPLARRALLLRFADREAFDALEQAFAIQIAHQYLRTLPSTGVIARGAHDVPGGMPQ